MLKYIVKRILSAIPVLLIVVFITFFMMRMLPGDVAVLILGRDASPGDLAILRETLGLNKPYLVQFVDYIGDLLRGDWGVSLYNNVPVFDNIRSSLEPTVLIMILSILISVVIGIPVGIISAVKRNSVLDYLLMSVSVLGLSIPVFWSGIMLAYYIGTVAGILPNMYYQSIAQVGLAGAVRCVILPSVALGFQSIASIARYTRSTMLDVLGDDYIRTARAKGLPERVVLYQHALKNAMSPVITHIGTNMASLMGGACVIETVFSINGMGKLAYDSLIRRDYTQVQAIILVVALVYIVINLLVDLLYKLFDPRVELN
ncbi:ABC transporter permease [Pseudoflavonifractor sp. MSJ-37]|uniref:ABC transporter permease n=1 Tax=Pseudoflavonifractor sp. MSJ-37 TaxID=2841531 RepID=UPI001C0F4B6B|nr:ABC transporter permease [Pseudoflavonifractor sp. MSJ-37]